MIPKADPRFHRRRSASGAQLGVDVGASLTKLAIRRPGGDLELRSISAAALAELPREVEQLAPERIGLTGGGGVRLRRQLGGAATVVGEFAAWGAGARALLRRAGESPPERFLLVSVGTGTSAMLVDGERVDRIGGTALGGGTIAGLAYALVGTADAAELAALAEGGDRSRVDLLVADAYPDGDFPLPAELNAASFAKLASSAGEAAPGDLVRAVMGLVGENIALICGGLAASRQVDRIVYGGTTLAAAALVGDILHGVAPFHGCRATILPDGAYTGAVGALELAAGE